MLKLVKSVRSVDEQYLAAYLLEGLRAGEKWRPRGWKNSTILGDGYVFINKYDPHTVHEHTPQTVSVSFSPAIYGILDKISRYGYVWDHVA